MDELVSFGRCPCGGGSCRRLCAPTLARGWERRFGPELIEAEDDVGTAFALDTLAFCG
jgi:hypothetical protein